jgi:hypothetical protein
LKGLRLGAREEGRGKREEGKTQIWSDRKISKDEKMYINIKSHITNVLFAPIWQLPLDR